MLTLSVCIGSACHLKGSYNVINAFQQLIEEYKVSDKVTLKAAFCLGHCAESVAVRIDEENKIFSVTGLTAEKFFKDEILPRLK